MPSAVTLRTDYSAADLRVLAKRTKDNLNLPLFGVSQGRAIMKLVLLPCKTPFF